MLYKKTTRLSAIDHTIARHIHRISSDRHVFYPLIKNTQVLNDKKSLGIPKILIKREINQLFSGRKLLFLAYNIIQYSYKFVSPLIVYSRTIGNGSKLVDDH